MTTFRNSAPQRPYTYVRQPQRETARRNTHGPLVGMNDNGRDWSARFFVISAFVIAALFVVELARGWL